ncbi:hypothetical protein Pan216_30170 [Planctomycetes bacterium Pan216]|uniref:Uncharacterized protein n=1 Tax=Kolteria novifilia TaxID=2527975 RepID=A0A518B593_9BACT|nr:hypothetical protein Pan216_30170 [Planctomycetes bacterium Pan216]
MTKLSSPLSPDSSLAQRFRVMGQWYAERPTRDCPGQLGQLFLVCFGRSEAACRRHLPEALAEYSRADLANIAWFWLEAWNGDEYVPIRDLNLSTIRRRAAAIETNRKRSA